jgi:hypothetical protein
VSFVFESDMFFYVSGTAFAIFGYAYLENARRQVEGLGSKVFIIPFACWFLYEYFLKLINSNDRLLQLTALLAVFCAVSPFFGFIWYGKGGDIRKKIFKIILFICIWALLIFIYFILFEKKVSYTIIVFTFITTFAFFSFTALKKKIKKYLDNKKHKNELKKHKKVKALKEQKEKQKEHEDEKLFKDIVEEMKR